MHRPVEHLRQGELGLQDRDGVAVAGLAVRTGEWVWEQAQPLAQKAVDLLRREAVADLLQSHGGRTAEHAVVERLEFDAFLRQLPLGVLVAVQAELGIERKVAAELEEERAEIAVERVDVIVVHHRGGPHDPRIRLPGLRVPALLGAEHRRLLLRLADEHHAFILPELAQMLLHHVVLALPLAELHQRYLPLSREALQLCYEGTAHRLHQRRRRQRLPAMLAKESHDPHLVLQPRHEHVEIHAVDPLDRKLHMMTEDIGYALCYHRTGSGRAVLPLAGV